MPKQLLLYELITPISLARHAEWSVKPDIHYSFAAEANAVPLMLVEFTAAAHAFPIVFAAEGDEIAPIAVLGLDRDKSLFVGKDGKWGSSYIPAFIRRYPFVFSASQDNQTLTLCIDESFDGFDRKGQTGQRLFDDAGQRTAFLADMLEFTNAYQGEHQRTRQLCALLKEFDILEPTEAKIVLPGGAERSLTGFQCASRDKMKALPPDRLAALAASDMLELVYLHLYSMRNFEALIGRLPMAA